MQEDHAARPEAPRAPGHGAAVIAVGRAADGEAGGELGMGVRHDLGHRHGVAERRLDLPPQKLRHGVGPAQRLEGAQAEARAFVLDVERGEAGLGRQARQGDQRRGRVALPGGDDDARLGQPGVGEDRVLLRRPGRVAPAGAVGHQGEGRVAVV
jgi:hypothetical protein